MNVWNIANIDRPSFFADLCSVSQSSSVENANMFCESLRTAMEKHASPSLRKVVTHNSSPWFESLSDELFMAMRERCEAERKWRNIKLTIFKDCTDRQSSRFLSLCAQLYVNFTLSE